MKGKQIGYKVCERELREAQARISVLEAALESAWQSLRGAYLDDCADEEINWTLAQWADRYDHIKPIHAALAVKEAGDE